MRLLSQKLETFFENFISYYQNAFWNIKSVYVLTSHVSVCFHNYYSSPSFFIFAILNLVYLLKFLKPLHIFSSPLNMLLAYITLTLRLQLICYFLQRVLPWIPKLRYIIITSDTYHCGIHPNVTVMYSKCTQNHVMIVFLSYI